LQTYVRIESICSRFNIDVDDAAFLCLQEIQIDRGRKTDLEINRTE